MSAILSASDLNDFISPGVACIKPVESLPAPPPSNPYEVTTEDTRPNAQQTAQISLTDCLACSGCVTSAEAVLVQLQSVQEVLDNLSSPNGRTFIALISPQSVASLAAVYNVSWKEARAMVEAGLGRKGFRLILDTDWARDIAAAAAFEELQGVSLQSPSSSDDARKKPILNSACPGFICYAEAVHPYLIPHLSRLKSPQAILGTFVKSVLPRAIAREQGYGDGHWSPGDVYVVGIQPCFDKKLEGARGELTSSAWMEGVEEGTGVRDVDCVITTRELVTLCGEEEFGTLPRVIPEWRENGVLEGMLGLLKGEEEVAGGFRYTPLPYNNNIPNPFSSSSDPSLTTGTSGGYLHYILLRLQFLHPGSKISITKGRNSDTVEYTLLSSSTPRTEIIKLARSYGFRNIQNLVRKLKPQKKRILPKFGRKGAGGQVVLGGNSSIDGNGTGYAYVEVMACPGGCTNGGGQVKARDKLLTGVDDMGASSSEIGNQAEQREWLSKVDEAYWSDDSSTSALASTTTSSTSSTAGPDSADDVMEIDSYPPSRSQQQHPFSINPNNIKRFMDAWSQATQIPAEKLLFTGYRKIEDEFNKDKGDEDPVKTATVRAAELASKAGGGW